jgi:hypothetical protein
VIAVLIQPDTYIAGSASSYAKRRTNLDVLIHDAVSGALRQAGTPLEQVDCVVSVSSDTVDGAIAPLLRSEACGARGRDYLNVTGASAAAIGAASALISSALADTVLVVGWGEFTKSVVNEVPALETDPAFARPLGIGSLQLAAMQTRWLMARGLVSQADGVEFADTMRARRQGLDELRKVRTKRLAAPREANQDGLCAQHMPDGIDRATALVLSRNAPRGPGRRLCIRQLATHFAPLWPEHQDLDPAVWVSQVLEQCFSKGIDLGKLSIELTSTNAIIGLRALNALGPAGDWKSNPLLNRFGGGVAGYTGAADGLARIDLWARAGSGESAAQAQPDGLVIELAGPIGQATAAIHITCEA